MQPPIDHVPGQPSPRGNAAMVNTAPDPFTHPKAVQDGATLTARVTSAAQEAAASSVHPQSARSESTTAGSIDPFMANTAATAYSGQLQPSTFDTSA
jgi:hypothetical protein